MSDIQDTLKEFAQEKRDASPYLSILPGESVRIVKALSIKPIEKEAFGAVKTVIRLTCLVDTASGPIEKSFDNGSIKWADELINNKIEVGNGFVITRNGEGVKTRYVISEIVRAESKPAVPASAPVKGISA